MANREVSFHQIPVVGWLQSISSRVQGWISEQQHVTRQVVVGAILALALLAFELFNYDTTEYALENLLGGVSFAGIRWATILAVAFCSIDFAGLARLLSPEQKISDGGLLKPVHLLLVAWLLGAAMNAMMTWWAVSLALMGHTLGNEVLSREQLLRGVPIFVALLVWITRLLIISSVVMTTDRLGNRTRYLERLARARSSRSSSDRERRPHAIKSRRSDPDQGSSTPCRPAAIPLQMRPIQGRSARPSRFS